LFDNVRADFHALTPKQTHCRARIADYKIQRIECRDSLPRSSAGKVLRSRL